MTGGDVVDATEGMLTQIPISFTQNDYRPEVKWYHIMNGEEMEINETTIDSIRNENDGESILVIGEAQMFNDMEGYLCEVKYEEYGVSIFKRTGVRELVVKPKGKTLSYYFIH